MSVKRASSEPSQTAKKVETSGEGDLSKLNTMYLDRFIQATSVAPKLIEMRMSDCCVAVIPAFQMSRRLPSRWLPTRTFPETFFR